MRTVTVPVIETDADNAAALVRMRELWRAEDGTIEAAERETLKLLVEAYEAATVEFPRSTPQELVRSVMDSHSLTQRDLVSIFGSQSRVSEFLSGRRSLGKDQAIRLHLRYRLPLDLLFEVPAARKPAA